MSIARASDSSGVIQKGMGEFVTVDYNNNLDKEKYVTKFGDDNCMPFVPVTIGEELATLVNISF